MDQNNNKNFLDKNTIVAIAVSMIFFVVWQSYVKKNYPQADQQVATTEQQKENADAHAKGEAAIPVGGSAAQAPTMAAAPAAGDQREEFVDYSAAQISFKITTLGMGLKNIDIRAYKTRDEKPITLGQVGERYPFGTYLAGNDQPLFFKIENTGPNSFRGVAQLGGMTIEKTITIDPLHYLINADVKVSGAGSDFKGLTTFLSDTLFDEPPSGGYFASRAEDQDIFYHHDDQNKHVKLSKKDGAKVDQPVVSVAALSSHYFTLAFVNRGDLSPKLDTNIPPHASTASLRLTHQQVNHAPDFKISYQAYAGPKQFQILDEIDPGLTKIINYGMFAWIAKPLLKLLRLLFSLFGNWGLAIIGLTIIVRLIVAPFNIYSFKSMKAMQKIQPEMARIREKYKNDPQVMNREVMDLMKRSGANPIGGCLPMLLQLPAFIALYAVLGQSIELYRAPFILWITDLSMKDQFYVLPVLMGVTMFIQQRITPSPNVDPAQQKVMQFMPILFTFFMISLPSGLTLYIFISTLFGITQQYLFMRERKNPDAKISQVQA
jgi:YidC/Oxa1 family membrane protein insertase